ncbi:MAG: WYL domain-containing protein [Lachnospiraceae bacterium]|nr:WYL domain-containing protein [Lachnospiraceae bacterium]
MSKDSSQKLKILYLMKILYEQTDDNHSITMPQIISALGAYGVNAERKSIYNDIERLREYGLDIIGEKHGSTYRYHVGARRFELAEVKLLVDLVQAAKFITTKKSNELIKKLEELTSRHEATKLNRQVYVAERVKTANEKIYYNVDVIHTAIGANCQIEFYYFQWNENKEMVLRKNGAVYKVSPWALSWADENYYLIAYDSEAGKIKHYRVDKMLEVKVVDEAREGRDRFNEADMARYATSVFGMYGGEERNVRLECDNSLAGVMIDRFGTDVFMHPMDENHFSVSVNVVPSGQFFGWIFALGEGVRIAAPEDVVENAREVIKRLAGQYLNN